MIAAVLQLAGLVAVIVGGALVAGPGGAVIGAGVSMVYGGLAADRAE